MKTFEDHGGLWPQSINECGRERPEPPLSHSKGGPDVNPLKNRISVRFATPLMEEIEIKTRPVTPQKTRLDPLSLEIMAWMEKTTALLL
jgi:hypothetical protein